MIPDTGTILAAHGLRWRIHGIGIKWECSAPRCTAQGVVPALYNASHAHAAHQLAMLADAGLLVIPTPIVDYMGPDDTVTTAYRGAARKLRGGFPAGGSKMRASIARTLEFIASAAEKGA